MQSCVCGVGPIGEVKAEFVTECAIDSGDVDVEVVDVCGPNLLSDD